MTQNKEALQHNDFLIGNRAAVLLEEILKACSQKKSSSTFPLYVREEYTEEIIKIARDIMKCCIFANGSTKDKRLSYQEEAQRNISYLFFLIRISHNSGWISEKKYNKIARLLSEISKRVINWKKSDSKRF